MALNFDKIISENENVSLEDLPIESLVRTDFDNNNAFDELFEDHMAILIDQNSSKNKLLTETMDKSDLYDFDVDCLDIDDNIEKISDINDPLPSCYINLIDCSYDVNAPEFYPDSDEIFSINGSEECDTNLKSNKKSNQIRRQSTRIQDQTRKKIAEQIQRENIRLAKEAQLLNSGDEILKSNDLAQRRLSRYLALPTDLDADDEGDNDDDGDLNVDDQWKSSDDDPNKLWCICKKPYGFRFMICCDNCSEWYHGDCVGVTQEEGARMEENGQDFICPICESNSPKKDSKPSEPVIISDDDVNASDDDNELLDGDDDCQIIKTIKPIPITANIFQIFKAAKPPVTSNSNKQNRPKPMPLSARTSVCLNLGCKTLVNPKRSLYCSKKCIEKYTRVVKKNNQKEKVAQYGLVKGTKLAKMTRFVLAQLETETIQNEYDAPTEENLKEFLLKNPTYKVFQNAKSTKSKLDQLKSKEMIDLLTKDAEKRVKVVKHFALIFKKIVTKSGQIEFRNIWQQCVNLEEGLFAKCDKSINEKYISKVKELSDFFKVNFESRLALDFLQEKLPIGDLLSMTVDQLEAKCKNLETVNNLKNGTHKMAANINKTGISTLLSDTTHLHNQHLYDINCKICNGASKLNAIIKQNQIKEAEKEKELKLQQLEKAKADEKDNISPPTDSCSSESIVTSWFNKSSELVKDLSPSLVINDELKVTSTVETPDMVIDMELCSTSSVNEPVNDDKTLEVNKVDSSSKIEITPSKIANSKPPRQKLTSVWEGEITYKDVGTMSCKTYLVSRHHLGKSKDDAIKPSAVMTSGPELHDDINLSANLGNQIKIKGRTKLLVVEDYLKRLRRHSNKEFLIFRLHPVNLEEGRKTYLNMFEFFHNKDRCGVIEQKKSGLKDCFIYPLNAHSKIPSFFLPLNGPGFEKRRPHMLLMLIVRSPLELTNYKSFSPKYDQDHEFIKNHGINLEKYCKPPVNACPSPISGFAPEEKSNKVVPENKSECPENNEILADEKAKDLETETKSIPEDNIQDVPLEDKMLEDDDYDEVEEENCSVKSNIYQRVVMNDEEKTNVEDKSSREIIVSPSENELIEEDSSKMYHTNFDQIFNPTKLGDDIIPFMSYPESERSNADSDRDMGYSRDFDLRVISDDSCGLIDKPLQTIFHTSYSIFSPPKHKRFYTFYDAHESDPDSLSKRAKYFFNPRLPSK